MGSHDATQTVSTDQDTTSTNDETMINIGSNKSTEQGRSSFKQSGNHRFNSGLTDEDSMSSEETKELPFSCLGLVGRSNEKQALQRIVDDVIPCSPSTRTVIHDQNTMILISGQSGSGKSALAVHFQQQCFQRHAFFVTGKFDLKQMEEPYSGIKAALADLCLQMLAFKCSDDSSFSAYSTGTSTDDSHGEDPRRLSALQRLLTDELSASEIQALSQVIPDILKVVGLPGETKTESTTDTERRVSQPDRMGYREQSGRLKFAMRSFLQVVCQFCPVVMVIDDLQWGDKASMDLLRSWMFMDAGANGHHSLLFMGCFRSDESEHNQVLQNTIEELKSAQEDRSIKIAEIHLGDMDVSQVHELVCGLLLPTKTLQSNRKCGDDVTQNNDSSSNILGNHESLALAHIVHKRTGENVFFIKQFLYQLFQDGLVYFDPKAQWWAWKSEAEIADNSDATTNIADIMKGKILHIKAARQILPVAACLGATFSANTLAMVIRSLSIHSDHAAFSRKTLDMPRIINDSWITNVLQSCER